MTITLERSVVLRGLIVDALLAYPTLATTNVVALGDWPTAPEKMPQILVYDGHTSQVSIARAQANFTATAFIMCDIRVESKTLADARDQCDQLEAQVKQAVLTSYDIGLLLQQYSSVQTQKKITSDANGMHVGQVLIEFGLEYFQSQEEYYTPVDPTPLEGANIHADLINVADPTGTYANPPFPDAVVPAPRTHGPDGRDEGYIEVDLPQPSP